MAEKNKTLYYLLFGFVALLFVAVVISVLSEQSNKVVELTSAQETFYPTIRDASPSINTTNKTLAHGTVNGWRNETAGCNGITLAVTNSSGFALTGGTTAPVGTTGVCGTNDYYYNPDTGRFAFCNSSYMALTHFANLTYANYQYCPDDYVGVSWGRSVMDMVPGFFALGALAVALLVALKLLRTEE